MKIVWPIVVILWITLSWALSLQAEVIIERHGEDTRKMSLNHPQGDSQTKNASLRIEEDGALRPLPFGVIPNSHLRIQALPEVPDTGGGTMVNVQGRFQSILKVAGDADYAIHQRIPEDRQPLAP